MRITLIGRGRVGSVLVRALRKRGWNVAHVPARQRTIRARPNDELVVIATRDDAISSIAQKLARPGVLSRKTAVVHVAGALGPEVLAPLAGRSAGVGAMHPLLSIASSESPPSFSNAAFLVRGDRAAVARARKLARVLGARAVSFAIDPALYHAAAALVANGSATIAALGAELLTKGGAPPREARKLLGPLLASVAHNVGVFGLPEALTGPVRRGDVATVERHLDRLKSDPNARRIYAALVLAQLPLAARLGEAPRAGLRAIQKAATRAALR
jgi:predicted short-subunit dehydrogenase-like oxidoreductase (DUF2520 family)